MPFAAPTNGPWGIQFGSQDFRGYNRSGADALAGQVFALNLGNTGAETTDNATGSKTSGLANVVDPGDNTVCGAAILCVALEAIADDSAGDFRVWGRVPALCDTGTIAINVPLGIDSGSNAFSSTVGAGEGVFGISLEALSTGTPADIFFNGYGISIEHS